MTRTKEIERLHVEQDRDDTPYVKSPPSPTDSAPVAPTIVAPSADPYIGFEDSPPKGQGHAALRRWLHRWREPDWSRIPGADRTLAERLARYEEHHELPVAIGGTHTRWAARSYCADKNTGRLVLDDTSAGYQRRPRSEDTPTVGPPMSRGVTDAIRRWCIAETMSGICPTCGNRNELHPQRLRDDLGEWITSSYYPITHVADLLGVTAAQARAWLAGYDLDEGGDHVAEPSMWGLVKFLTTPSFGIVVAGNRTTNVSRRPYKSRGRRRLAPGTVMESSDGYGVIILDGERPKAKSLEIRCQCRRCGREFWADHSKVKRGHTTSCGCRKKMAQAEYVSRERRRKRRRHAARD